MAAGATLAAAEPFFFKATALGRYLLQARDRQLLTLADAGAVMAVEPSDAADFTVQRSGSGFSLFAATRSQYLGAGDQGLSATATTSSPPTPPTPTTPRAGRLSTTGRRSSA